MAALQQSPITIQSRYSSPPSTTQILAGTTTTTTKLSLSSGGLKLPKLTIRSKNLRQRRSRPACGPRMADTAAGSYAAALADVAKSNNTLDQTSSDIEKIEKIFSDIQVLDFFTNPTIDKSRQRSVIDEISNSASLQPHVVNLLNILVDMKRMELIKEIVKEFEVVYNKLTDIELAVVTSVVRLESGHLAQIAKSVQKLTGAKNFRIKTVIDRSLLAGSTVRYGNGGSKLIDMSVKKQLEEIAAQLDIGDVQLAA